MQRQRLHEVIRTRAHGEECVHRAGRNVVGLIVEDRNLRRVQPQRTARKAVRHEIEQSQIDQLVGRIGQRVVNDRDLETRGRHPRGHDECAIGLHVIHVRDRRAPERSSNKLHRHAPPAAVGAHRRDRREATVLRHTVDRRAEAHHAEGILIQNGNLRVRDRTRGRPGDVSQRQVKEPVTINQEIVDDPDRDRTGGRVGITPD